MEWLDVGGSSWSHGRGVLLLLRSLEMLWPKFLQKSSKISGSS